MLRHALLLALFALTAIAQTPAPGTQASGPVQPIPYSHKQHLAMGLNCQRCHEMPEPGASMGIPATDKCMACHNAVKQDSPHIQKLAQFHKDGKGVPWVRVYRVPDYVDFSHKVHLTAAKATCEQCHGPVRERDVIRKETNISMAGCVDCHRTNNASMACNFCHEAKD